MTLRTRQPTGKPPWPIVLITGAEKAGKTYACAEASSSPHIGRTFWVSIGEDDPDEYGAIPGARFEIVEHQGTYRSILQALTDAAAEPPADGRPNLLVVDSGTRLWDLLCDEQQVEANRRARAKAERQRRSPSEDDAVITMDQWNAAKQRWAHCIDVLREHPGPSIVTARLDTVTVVDSGGNPTKDKDKKVKAEKSLPSEVGVIVEMPVRGEAWLTGVRSLRLQLTEPRVRLQDFTVQSLWDALGVTEAGGTTPRQHTANNAAPDTPGGHPVTSEVRQLQERILEIAEQKRLSREEIIAEFDAWKPSWNLPGGATIGKVDAVVLQAFIAHLTAEKPQVQPPEQQELPTDLQAPDAGPVYGPPDEPLPDLQYDRNSTEARLARARERNERVQ